MGLDITAYENIEFKEVIEDESEVSFYNGGYFEQSNMTEIENKNLEISFSRSHDFRAGSYGGYGVFRNNLSVIINNRTQDDIFKNCENESIKKLPFFYLINFSDCEGYIGTSYCEILYNDFCKHEEEYMEKQEHEYAKEKYLEFKKAFELAKNNGLVNFH